MGDDDAVNVLNAAHEHFAKLAHVLAEAMTQVGQLDDEDMIDRLRLAKAAAERGQKAVAKWRSAVAGEHDHGNASAANAHNHR